MSDYQYGYRNRIAFSDHSDYFNISKSSTAVFKSTARVAGVHIRNITASAGNVPVFKIQDGTASGGTVVFASTALGETMVNLPYVRVTTGLFADISGSATLVDIGLYYIKDD